jgi:hypothetical protein
MSYISDCMNDDMCIQTDRKRENKRSTNSSLEDTTHTSMCAIWDVVEKKKEEKDGRKARTNHQIYNHSRKKTSYS